MFERTDFALYAEHIEDVLTDLVNDYFVTRPISNSNDDTESSDDDVDIDPDVHTAGE